MKTVVTITGASGSGKSTLEKMLAEEYDFKKIVSFTTRDPRKGENHGKDYYFITHDYARQIVEAGDAVESITFGNDIYGISAVEFEGDGSFVVVVEPNGLAQVTEYCAKRGWNHIAVYLENEKQFLIERFMNRYIDTTITESDVKVIGKRLNMLDSEMNWKVKTELALAGKEIDIVSTFDETNQYQVADDIGELALVHMMHQ